MSRPSSAYRNLNRADAWSFSGLRITPDTATLWASRVEADPADPSADHVAVIFTQTDEGDLLIDVDVPDGHCHVVTVTESGLRIAVADVSHDCCKLCAEHLSNPHAPGCPIGASEQLRLLAGDVDETTIPPQPIRTVLRERT